MKIIGIITEAYAPESGVNEKTGLAWHNQSFTVEEVRLDGEPLESPNRMVFTTYDTNIIGKLVKGMTVQVFFTMTTRQGEKGIFMGARIWHNGLKCLALPKKGAGVLAGQSTTTSTPQPQPQPKPVQQTPTQGAAGGPAQGAAPQPTPQPQQAEMFPPKVDAQGNPQPFGETASEYADGNSDDLPF